VSAALASTNRGINGRYEAEMAIEPSRNENVATSGNSRVMKTIAASRARAIKTNGN
jgi:hypothetical protein